MSVGPLRPVPPPPATPPLHSLVASAQPVNETDDRWLAGITWAPETCGVEWGVWDPCPIDDAGHAATGTNYKSEAGGGAPIQVYSPFTVELESTCNAAMFQMDLEARARRQLEAYTPRAVELEFWTGSLRPDNFSLVRSTPATVVDVTQDRANPTAFGVVGSTSVPSPDEEALVLLASALRSANAGSRGMIHASSALVERWATKNFLKEDGARLVTKARGDVVVAYTGTDSSGPQGLSTGNRVATTAQAWAYATGMCMLRLSPVEVYANTMGEILDHRDNRIRYRVERSAAVTTEGCASFAVLCQGIGGTGL